MPFDFAALNTKLQEVVTSLQEKSTHWPFKPTKWKRDHSRPPSKVGDAIRGRVNPRKNYWVCKSVGKYVQRCKGKGGEKKIVRIDKAWKSAYNAAYKQWRAKLKAKLPPKKYVPGKPG